MTSFVLKLIACIAMLIDHSALVFEAQLSAVDPWVYIVCRMIGRLAFPVFAMCIGEGVIHTSSPKKYLARMLLFAFIAQIPFSLMVGTQTASFHIDLFGRAIPVYGSCSVMVTLFLGLAACVSIHEGVHVGAAFAIAAACILDRTIGMDYGLTGVLLIICLYLARSNRFFRMLMIMLFAICLYIEPLKQLGHQLIKGDGPITVSSSVLFCSATMLSSLLVLCYNKRKGQSSKLLIYLFYPVHMLILWIMWLLAAN